MPKIVHITFILQSPLYKKYILLIILLNNLHMLVNCTIFAPNLSSTYFLPKKNTAAKLRKKNETTKKNVETMKKTMLIIQVLFYSTLAGLSLFQTIYSCILAGQFYAWQVGFAAISILLVTLVAMSVRELVKSYK